MSWMNRPGNWRGKGAMGAQYVRHGNDLDPVAVTTYRRANGAQVGVSKPRVVRASKTFPRAHTPSPEARRRANLKRRGLVAHEDLLRVALANQ